MGLHHTSNTDQNQELTTKGFDLASKLSRSQSNRSTPHLTSPHLTGPKGPTVHFSQPGATGHLPAHVLAGQSCFGDMRDPYIIVRVVLMWLIGVSNKT